jgi:cytochrome P450
MSIAAHAIVPPAPRVRTRRLSSWRGLAILLRNPLTVFTEEDFEAAIVRSRLLGRDNLMVNDPVAVRHILSSPKYRRPMAVVRPIRWLAGNGLFLAEGEAWRTQRRMLAPLFTPAQLGGMLPHFRAAALSMLGRLAGRAEVELAGEFNQTTLDSFLRALFSMPADTVGADLASAVRRYLDGPGRPRLLDGVARTETSFAFLDGPRRRFRAEWLETVDSIIGARKAPRPGDAPRDLLDVMLAGLDPDTGAALSVEEVRDQIGTFLVAGFETTTRLLFWAAYLLTLDGDEQARIRLEIADFPPDQAQTFADLERWPRLRGTLLEALRLYPPVSLLLREAVERDEVLGETVEPGALIVIAPWTLHRHKAHWEAPLAFMPERFLGERQPWTQGAFLPFGIGPRICIGANFALAEAALIMATLLERYEVGLVGSRPVLPVGRVTTVPNYEPRFSLRAREP